MYAKYIIRKILKKILTLPVLIVVFSINIIFKLFQKLLSRIAIPAAFTGVLASLVYMIYSRTFSIAAIGIMALSGLIVLVNYLLPRIGLHLDYIMYVLKDTVSQPIIIRSPVKYTI